MCKFFYFIGNKLRFLQAQIYCTQYRTVCISFIFYLQHDTRSLRLSRFSKNDFYRMQSSSDISCGIKNFWHLRLFMATAD